MTILLAINSMIASAIAFLQADGEPPAHFNQGQLALLGIFLLVVIVCLIIRRLTR